MLKIENTLLNPQEHSMRLEVWSNDGTELWDSQEKRDGVKFLANGHAVQELLDEIHEEKDENRQKSFKGCGMGPWPTLYTEKYIW